METVAILQILSNIVQLFSHMNGFWWFFMICIQ